ncbi:MAG: class I SAM-dependent methyltransferase, partial [Thermoplasmata archaeon]|nr:class I SAM-dependent methyltransferase [Thermoplasmata archaeon]
MSSPSLVETLGDQRAAPDIPWVQELTGATRAEVERLLLELEEHRALEAEIHRLHTEAGRPFYAQICVPFELYALTRLTRPEEIVETGVSSGVSSVHFLLALAKNGEGRLHSIDLPTREGTSPVRLPPGRNTGWVVPSSLHARWDLNLGPSEAILPDLVKELNRVDLFLHDSHHTPEHLTFELETVRPRLRAGSIVLADNTNWTGKAFPEFARSFGVKVARRRESYIEGFRVPRARSRRTASKPNRTHPTKRSR